MSKNITAKKITEYFQYLDNLRSSGVTNMWGSGAYVKREFKQLSEREVGIIVVAWMDTFEHGVGAEGRATASIETITNQLDKK